jgi:hypothetical protein
MYLPMAVEEYFGSQPRLAHVRSGTTCKHMISQATSSKNQSNTTPLGTGSKDLKLSSISTSL